MLSGFGRLKLNLDEYNFYLLLAQILFKFELFYYNLILFEWEILNQINLSSFSSKIVETKKINAFQNYE